MAAIQYYISSLKSERLKLKRTFALWLTIISALIVPVLFFIVYLIRYKHVIPVEGANPWDEYLMHQVRNAIPFLVPMFIVLITSLIIQIEHKATGIKQLFVFAVPKWSIYFGKLSSVLIMIASSYVLFYVSILCFGYILGAVHSELQFLNFSADHGKYIPMLFNSFIGSLGIVAIQFWLSFRFKNFIVPLGVGMTLVILGLIGAKASEAIYFPYAYNVLSLAGDERFVDIFGMPRVLVFSTLCFVVVNILGYLNIYRMNIK